MNESLPKLLIVDDEEDLAQLLADFLEDDFLTTIENNPRESLTLIENNNYDLIISDLQMPEVSGHEVIAHAKKCNPKTPVLIMTGSGKQDPATLEAIEKGADGVIVKPFTGLSELADFLKKHLSA